jgi:hypothetical protein
MELRDEKSNRWVHFFIDSDEHTINRSLARSADPSARYRVRGVVPVAGRPPAALSEGMCALRHETSAGPHAFDRTEPGSRAPKLHLWGVVQHLHYTGRNERLDLDARSRPELAPSDQTLAVVIPIRKSPDWWNLTQDERQKFFHRQADREGHIATGARYADGIFRRLYHGRYLDPAPPYDFLTYFEFAEQDTLRFRTLLSELRDLEKNPEWHYVEQEYEIWMTKAG